MHLGNLQRWDEPAKHRDAQADQTNTEDDVEVGKCFEQDGLEAGEHDSDDAEHDEDAQAECQADTLGSVQRDEPVGSVIFLTQEKAEISGQERETARVDQCNHAGGERKGAEEHCGLSPVGGFSRATRC